MSSDSEHAFTASIGSYDPMSEDGQDYFDEDEQNALIEEYLTLPDPILDSDGEPISNDETDVIRYYQQRHRDLIDTGSEDEEEEEEEDDDDNIIDFDLAWLDRRPNENENEPPQFPQHPAAVYYDNSGEQLHNPGVRLPSEPVLDSSSQSESESEPESESESESASASAESNNSSSEVSSPSAAASPESSEEQEDPPRHNRRPVSIPFGINARASPRRPSLTPDIHPNRRLPRSAPTFTQRRRREQLYRQQQNPSRPGPSHSRRAYPANDDTSDDDDEQSPSSSSSEDDLDQEDESIDNESTEDENQSDEENDNDNDDDDDDDEEDEEVNRLRELEYWHVRAYLSQRAARGRERQDQAGQRRAGPVREEGMDGDDELIEVVYHQPAPPQQQRRSRHPQQGRPNNNHNHDNNPGPAANSREPVQVIDLTEEPDSPVLQRNRPISLPRHHPHDAAAAAAAPHQRRNPRRQMSQVNGRAPALARSDGSLLGNAAPVIDLTSDSPDDERENIPANRFLPLPVPQQQRNNNNNSNNHRQSFGRGFIGNLENLRDIIIPRLGLLAHIAASPNDEVEVIGHHEIIPINPNPLAGNPPDFNYQANGFGGFGGGRPPTPKPDFEAPPPPRPGFTRDTGNNRETDEEQIFVCPSCEEELKYSPEGDEDGPRPAKRARTKKDREEHHFWAVKACGHVRRCFLWKMDRGLIQLLQVYCKSCYDNRKKSKDRDALNLGFEFISSASSKTMKTLCAVNDCETDVTSTSAWVGIFM